MSILTEEERAEIAAGGDALEIKLRAKVRLLAERREAAAIAVAEKRMRATHAVEAMLEMALDNDDMEIAGALSEALELIG